MYKEGYEHWTNLNMNPLKEFGKISSEFCQHAAEQNAEILNECCLRLTEQSKRFGDVRKPEDFFRWQKDCINENITATTENLQKLIQLSMENLDAFNRLWNQGFQKFDLNKTKATEKYKSE